MGLIRNGEMGYLSNDIKKNGMISMNKNYENLINNLKNRIIEQKFIFSIDYLNKKLPDEIIYKISTYL